MSLPACISCQENLTYQMGELYVCPLCGHEWTKAEEEASLEASLTKDVNGNILESGDTVTVVKDLKLNAKQTIKQGTKVKNIQVLENPVNDHDLSAKLEGFGSVYLKSSVVKK